MPTPRIKNPRSYRHTAVSVVKAVMDMAKGLRLTDTNENGTDDALDRVSAPERLAPVHRKVGSSPEDVTEPGSKERTDCKSRCLFSIMSNDEVTTTARLLYSLTLSKSPKKGIDSPMT